MEPATPNSRRDFLKKTSIITLAGITGVNSLKSFAIMPPESSVFTLPPMRYAFDALEPFIDKMTMEIHYTKHHQAYVDNLNKAVTAEKATGVSLENLCKNASKYSAAIRNNAGGHYNHTLYWDLMKPHGGGAPMGVMAEALKSTFGGFEEFKTKFNDAAKSRFGSGWAWLVKNAEGRLEIGTTPNQDNPLMDVSELKGRPLIGIDVWEHAYYLKYQNKRADYLTAWWNTINWDEVMKNFAAR